MLVTALVVARPLVLGEDPGLSAPSSDNGSMVLSLLWFIAGVAWAGWRLKANRGEWYVGLVEAGLGVAVIFYFAGAEAAAHKHPARIIAWEWLVLLVSFVVVRHLSAAPEARSGLFAALLATGLMVSAQGVYQAVVEIPAMKRLTEAELREQAAKQGMQSDDAHFEMLYRRVQDGHADATFAHPNSYAGYLVLILPGLVGAVIVCLRNKADVTVTRLTATAALIGMLALWVTHSRGGLLAVAVVAVGTAALVWRRQLLAHKGLALGAVVAMAAAGAGLFFSGVLGSAFGKDAGTMAARIDYWRATAKMIADHPWLGVGSGNFGGYYPRYMAETAGEKIKDPHNFVLELWATGGVFVLLAVLTALGAFFLSVRRGIAAPGTAETSASPPTAIVSAGRWEYFAGGVIGLLLAFVLRLMATHGPDEVLQEGLSSAGRSLVWFLGFALFERVPWSDRQRVVALTAGVVALLLNLGVSGGIAYPSVAGPLWFAIALALASLPLAPYVFPRAPLPSLVLPFPVFGLLAVFYLVSCFYPVTSSLSLVRTAERNSSVYQINRTMLPALTARVVGLCASPYPTEVNWTTVPVLAVQNPPMRDWTAAAPELLFKAVIKPLEEAAKDDPLNSRVAIQLGTWYGEFWELMHVQDVGTRAEEALLNAQSFDPNGLEPLQAEVQLLLTFSRYSRLQADAAHRTAEAVRADPKPSAEEKKKRLAEITKKEADSRARAAAFLQKALESLRKAVELDPTDAPLRYQLAELLNRVGDADGCREQAKALHLDVTLCWQCLCTRSNCREQAAKALYLDAVSTLRPRKLTEAQRSQAETWAAPASDR
jgi:O-antigen ligase